MIQLSLTEPDAAVLKDILDACVGDLGMEIAHTDSMDFREGLKRRKAIAADIAGRLQTALAAAAT